MSLKLWEVGHWKEWKTEREKRRWEGCDYVKLREGERQKENTYLLRIEMKKMSFFMLCCRWRRTSVDMKSSEWEKRITLQWFFPRRSWSSGCWRRSWYSSRRKYKPWKARVRVRFLPQLVLFVPSSVFNVFIGLYSLQR